jgi:hypothetical protein
MRTLLRLSFRLACALLLPLETAAPAPAQTIEVQNGTTVQVQNGSVLDLEGGTMDLGGAGATATLDEQGAGRVAGGTLTATRSLNGPSQAEPAGLGVVLTTSADLGAVTLTRGHTAQSGGGNTSIERYVDILPSQNNSGLSATLTLEYRDDELNGQSEPDLEFFRSTDDGATWSAEGIASLNESDNTATLNGISAFDRFTLGSAAQSLPVELARLEGTVVESDDGARPGPGAAVQLTWTTTSETRSAGFEVQRRAEGGPSGGTWTRVGYRESKAEGSAATEALTYRFTDPEVPYAADSVRYRLRQVDVDGSATLSDPVTVARPGVSEVQLLGTAPNPARRQATVRYGLPEGLAGDNVTMRLYDVLGRQVRSADVQAEPGRHKQTLDVTGLSSGVYFLRLRAGGQTKTRKMTVVR